MSIQEIQFQLKARERQLGRLERKRERLHEQLREVENEIVAISGSASGNGRGRPHNEKNLGDALVEVLKDKPMSVAEAAQAVRDKGYRTTAANFRVIVNQRLINDKRIKKVSRGVYTA